MNASIPPPRPTKLNRVYELLSRYHNYAQPCLRLESKTLTADGARVQPPLGSADALRAPDRTGWHRG
jgi:hypothetical protein